ncbi:MAG: hypothetical protein IJW02_01355 [Clostridia bacterium]|nr:hypothetical protein [Clostridia bacterium]
MSLLGAKNGTVGEVTNGQDAEADTKLQKMMNLEKLSSKVIYRDVLDGVDLEYVAYSMNVKENIIVKERKDSYSYSFELKLNGLTPTLAESGDIEIRDGEGAVKYVIPAPVVFDSNGEYAPSGLSAYTLTHNNGHKYTLTVTVDTEWMNEETRAFPVTVDPTVRDYNSNVVDTFINSDYPNGVYNGSSTLYVSSTRRAYWKSLSLPAIPVSAVIYDASIRISTIGQIASGSYVGVYGVKTDWGSDLTWNKYANNGSGVIDSFASDYCIINGIGEYTFNVTKIAKRWYEGDEYQAVTQLGLAFATIPGRSASIQFYSNEASPETNKPLLVITYKDMKGAEPYWSYSAHSVGIAGSGSVNLANGNLVFAIPTLTSTDSLFGYTPTLVYNSAISNQWYCKTYDINSAHVYQHAPYGFKLNACETVVWKKARNPVTNEEVIYYIYADADGTEHEFYYESNGIYKDDDGLNYVMIVSDNAIEIIDDSNTTRKFLKMSYSFIPEEETLWYLSEIVDATGNKLIFSVNNKYHPTSISILPKGNTTPIEMLKLIYNSENILCAVYNPASKQSVVLRYTSLATGTVIGNTYCRYLKRVEYCYGNGSTTEADVLNYATSATNNSNVTCYETAEYFYDDGGRMIEAVNLNSVTSVKYAWQKRRVIRISEYAGENTGGELGIEYSLGYTEMRSTGNDEVLSTNDDILTRYIFDTYGRAISVYSCSSDGRNIYGAVSGKYDTEDESKNSVSEKTVLGEINSSLIKNGDFQGPASTLSSVTYWTVSSNVSRIPGTTVDTPNTLFLSMSPTESTAATASQTVTLGAGNYAFSMQYESSNCENISGKVEFIDTDTSLVIHAEDINLNKSDVVQRSVLLTSFSLTDETDVELKISFSALGAISSAVSIRVGKAKLELGNTFSEFTLINAGGFDTELNPSDHWQMNSGSLSLFTDPTTGDVSVKMSANGGTKYVMQNVLTKTASSLNSAADTSYGLKFAVSGYARADCPLEDKSFSIYVKVKYNYGTSSVTVEYPFHFTSATNEWQYVSGVFCLGTNADGTKLSEYQYVQSIDVVCDYSGQIIGNVYFDDISLVYAGIDKTQRTTYDKGLVTMTDDGIMRTYYEYDDNRNVIRVANSKGELVDYFYKVDQNTGNATNTVDHIVTYEFTYNGGLDYPYSLDDPDSQIVKTPKFRTNYTYNSYGMVTEVLSYETESGGAYVSGDFYSKQKYTYDVAADSKIFGALLTEKNSECETRYFYDTSSGWLLASVNTESYFGYSYTYDESGKLLRVDPAKYMPNTSSYSVNSSFSGVEYDYDGAGRLSGISTYSTDYTLSYNIFGNSESISIGSDELASYEYNENNGKLKRIIYGNGYEVEYVYNDLELVEAIKCKENSDSQYVTAYEYKYTSDGKTHSVKDNINSRVTVYRYDENNRLVEISEYSSSDYDGVISTEIEYDSESRVQGTTNHISYSYVQSGVTIDSMDSIERAYTYLSDGRLNSYTVSGNFAVSAEYTYDSLDRVSSVEYNDSVDGAPIISESYTYVTDTVYGESGLIRTYTVTVGTSTKTYTYTYNNSGNITKISTSDGKEISYTYDSLGQLTYEDNDVTGCTYTYTYDRAGNLTQTVKRLQSESSGGVILGEIGFGETALPDAKPNLPSLTVTNAYSYTDSQWGDLLTSYNGTTITYDEIGNPLSYYNGSSYTFGWEGRRLVSATKGAKSMSFAYNSDGLRISKTVNGVARSYVYDGELLVAEYTDSETIVYIYDAYDSPIGFKCRTSSYASDTWDVYWYGKNLQGDIISVYSSTGTVLVNYKYNAWGATTKTYSNNGLNTTADKNNLTYRGYYYDSDLGLYYLQSRYYDPNTCRFINADSALYHSILGYNMFAYCGNNPVNYYDPTGENEEIINWPIYTAWLPLIDGPLPIGDILYIGLFIVVVVIVLKAEEAPPPTVEGDSSNVGAEPNSLPELDDKGREVVRPGQQPTEREKYLPPKGGPVQTKSKNGKKGWKDKNGNVWIPVPTGSKDAHGGGHWDVESPKGGYINVYPGGQTRGGEAPYPNIPVSKR